MLFKETSYSKGSTILNHLGGMVRIEKKIVRSISKKLIREIKCCLVADGIHRQSALSENTGSGSQKKNSGNLDHPPPPDD